VDEMFLCRRVKLSDGEKTLREKRRRTSSIPSKFSFVNGLGRMSFMPARVRKSVSESLALGFTPPLPLSQGQGKGRKEKNQAENTPCEK
jgi:hypothetical protein